MISAPVACLTLNILYKSLMIGRKTHNQTKQFRNEMQINVLFNSTVNRAKSVPHSSSSFFTIPTTCQNFMNNVVVVDVVVVSAAAADAAAVCCVLGV